MRDGSATLYVYNTYICDVCSDILVGECVQVNNITYKIENKVYPVISNPSGTFEYNPRLYSKPLYPHILQIVNIIKKDYLIDILSNENDMFWDNFYKKITLNTLNNYIDEFEFIDEIKSRLNLGDKVSKEILEIFIKTA